MILSTKPEWQLHQNDLPEGLEIGDWAAIDTEALGLQHGRDRLCMVQVCFGENFAHCIQVSRDASPATSPNLCRLLADSSVQKIFHFAPFDLGILYRTFGIACENVFCTRIASKIARTNTESHSLKTLCNTLLGINLPKDSTSSDWGAETLTKEQLEYAARDVVYLREIKNKLEQMLVREARERVAANFMKMVSLLIEPMAQGWGEEVLRHH